MVHAVLPRQEFFLYSNSEVHTASKCLEALSSKIPLKYV